MAGLDPATHAVPFPPAAQASHKPAPSLMQGRVLTIAGSDSGGGAGIQADIKTITALNAYAATALTAITVQDTVRVHQVHKLPPELISAQIACVLSDPGADAIKTGMLSDAATIAAVSKILAEQGRGLPLVVDPVMLATSGDTLLDPDAITALRSLFRQATLITPNAPETAALTGITITTLDSMRQAARLLLQTGPQAVLIKGGHTPSATITDLLVTQQGETPFTHPRQQTRNTHGTGCTLASAIATGLAQSLPLTQAVARAVAYVQQAITEAPNHGAGNGPLNHAITVRPFTA
jgi:hydroxymethylpyrimidine/phosphomethylpyrimidine kinase